MLKVDKKSEPSFLTDFKKRNKPSAWDDYNQADIKPKLKEFMLENEQDGYCPYCEVYIKDDKSHIEHIRPKDIFPKVFDNHDNLMACCMSPNTCGGSKANKYDENFINPVIKNPKEYLEYDLSSGDIVPIHSEGEYYEMAMYTIDLLNLNYRKLSDARRSLSIELNYLYEESDFDYYKDELKKFPSLIDFIKEDIFG
ncbi:TIGR02646 family protein [Romboutsia sedimentorum]|uniref:retron system putative HNH endonuclease n=1 Tax=Romboutsia sedimentorum TaxID=1368474 RepID=UPI0024DE9BE7|nr:retron system putative HNH endonuclease [Romboutsia sedimentorum]MDK2585334.1 TIGR02646 family protein [Romboutsia sedimentorum]